MCAVDSSPWEVFKTQIVSEAFVRFSNLLGSYPKANGLGTPPTHTQTPTPPLRNSVIVYQRKGEMWQREGSQKTNLEVEVPFQSYSFSEMANLEILQKCDNLMDI